MKRAALIFTMMLAVSICHASVPCDDIVAGLNRLDGVRVVSVETDADGLTRASFFLRQPLDHKNPGVGSFEQYLELTHRAVDRPTVLVTEGYALGHNFCGELYRILEANELRVEHRFFGKSVVKERPLRYLTMEQAVADYHRIVVLMRGLYPQPWVSCGWSKGGQTAVSHRRFYPEDVAVTVAYDAPFNNTPEDVRINRFFDQVGTAFCRDRLIAFQRLVLKNRDRIRPLFDALAKERSWTFDRLGYERALDYIVLEYPFSFWQYSRIDCHTIPDRDSPIESIFDHLKQVVAFSSYADRSFDSVAMHQFFSQLGYYGYVKKNVADLLDPDFHYSNAVFAPGGMDTRMEPSFMEDINRWIHDAGDGILYIYGEQDPWSAPHAVVPEERDALVCWVPGGNHFSYIETLPLQEKMLAVTQLRFWIQACARDVNLYPGMKPFENEED